MTAIMKASVPGAFLCDTLPFRKPRAVHGCAFFLPTPCDSVKYAPSWVPFKKEAKALRTELDRIIREPYDYLRQYMVSELSCGPFAALTSPQEDGTAVPCLVQDLLAERSDGSALNENLIMWTAGTMFAGTPRVPRRDRMSEQSCRRRRNGRRLSLLLVCLIPMRPAPDIRDHADRRSGAGPPPGRAAQGASGDRRRHRLRTPAGDTGPAEPAVRERCGQGDHAVAHRRPARSGPAARAHTSHGHLLGDAQASRAARRRTTSTRATSSQSRRSWSRTSGAALHAPRATRLLRADPQGHRVRAERQVRSRGLHARALPGRDAAHPGPGDVGLRVRTSVRACPSTPRPARVLHGER